MPINPADRGFSDDDLRALFSGSIPERVLMSFMLDEGVSQTIVSQFERAIPKLWVTTVQEQALDGESSDFRVLAHARSLGCALITVDRPIKALHERLQHLDLDHSGLLILTSNATDDDLLRLVQFLYDHTERKQIPPMHLLYNMCIMVRKGE